MTEVVPHMLAQDPLQRLILVGVNHHQSPIEAREQLAFPTTNLSSIYQAFLEMLICQEVMVISTCNRTEVFAVGNSLTAEHLLEKWLEVVNLPAMPTEAVLFTHYGETAIRHITQVACGLDSMVLGEPQIFGQIKDAYREAQSYGGAGALLQYVLPYVFAIVKTVRTETSIGELTVTLPSATLTLAKRIFSDIKSLRVILIGAGEMIESMAKYLISEKVKEIVILNRTYERGLELANTLNITAGRLENLQDELIQSDMVVSCTASHEILITRETTEIAIKQRRHRPIYMMDWAVPRDIDPTVSELNDIYYFTLDDLEELIQEHRQARLASANAAEEKIRIQLLELHKDFRIRVSSHFINKYRFDMQRLCEQEIEKVLQKTASQSPIAEELLRQFASRLSNKLMHWPTQMLRHLAASDHNLHQLPTWVNEENSEIPPSELKSEELKSDELKNKNESQL
ncbi:MAG: glutamyl-tRNA reductase [Pseudomonadota bacterium]